MGKMKCRAILVEGHGGNKMYCDFKSLGMEKFWREFLLDVFVYFSYNLFFFFSPVEYFSFLFFLKEGGKIHIFCFSDISCTDRNRVHFI